MRTPLVMGNWKLNGTKESVTALVNALKEPANKAAGKAEVAVCAPAVFIGMVEQLSAGSKLAYGSEDCDIHTSGAYTGENSPVMLREFGCTYAIVRHFERHNCTKESNEYVAQKYQAAQQNGLIPVLCVGESEAQFDAGRPWTFRDELKAVIDLCGIDSFKNAVIAYEPSGLSVPVRLLPLRLLQKVHADIRAYLAEFSKEVADGVRILYGGSCNAKTAPELFAQADIDGGLVGGASLKAPDFTAIIEAAVANA